MGMDEAALDALAAERIDWRYKGFPAAFDGFTVGGLLAAEPRLAQFGTPLLTLDADALEHNIATMAQFCATHAVSHAPHGKTTMAPQLFARQLAAGAWGITAATFAHVRAYRAFGVETIVLANELIDPDALGWVARELRRVPGFRLVCFADSVSGVEIMRAALAAADAPRPADAVIDVVIDLGHPGCRTGCRDADEAERVARSVQSSRHLRMVGVGGFEGALAADRSEASLARVRAYLRSLRGLVQRLDGAGLFDETEEIVVTAGGGVFFDEAVDVLAGGWSASRPVHVVLRSGAYITHDDGHYKRWAPSAEDGSGLFRSALSIHGRVLSLPEPGLALLDFGKRDAPLDLGLPVPRTVRRADESVEPLAECTITALADQHAFLSYGTATRLAIGDVVACGISHPCTAFDKWKLIPVVDGGRVVDVVRTFF
jgi:D-serine deaminase-like pyridoxal phosphate-dependent protein